MDIQAVTDDADSKKRRSAATASATLPSPGRVIEVRRGEDRGRGIKNAVR
jgi:hypothetical protein